MTRLENWLNRHGLDRYATVLAENDIDFDVLGDLTEADLKELGFSLGHRRRFFRALTDRDAGGDPPDRPAPEPANARPKNDPAAGEAGERRQMTVAFCDLVDSTALATRLDPEEMSALLQRYTALAAQAITDHGGYVAKFLGDGVLAYYGWPRAREDAAECAVEGGLAATAAVATLEGPDGPLAARVGIATGPVVVSDLTGASTTERGAVAGATPNLAARLQTFAAPGEVMIQEGTRRLIGDLFELEEAEAADLKGFDAPVTLWRVLGRAEPVSRFHARHGGSLTAFVGRENEAAILRDRWERARAREGQAVLVAGEPGIGKSRILHEFRTWLEGDGTGDATQIHLQCSPYETDTAFSPFLRELATSCGIADGMAAEARRARLDAHLARLLPESGLAADLLAPLLGLPVPESAATSAMSPQRRKQAVMRCLSERLLALAADAPLVILAEDLHWSDPSSGDVLDSLVGAIEARPILLVATTRPGPEPEWIRHGHATIHSLNRLSRTNGRAIAAAVAGGKALPEPVLAEIIARTDGVPLFVEELTKTILETGLLADRGDRYELEGSLPQLAIPTTLQDSLMARLDRMSAVKQVIQAAASIGRSFDADLLARVLDTSPEALAPALDQLVGAELIFRQPDGGGGRYIFKHALVQDAAYESLLSAPRQGIHRRIAAALEATGETEPGALARHHAAAGNSLRATGLFLEAGRASLGSSALDEAISAFEKGLETVPLIGERDRADRLELDLRVGLGTARMARFGWASPAVAEAMEPAFPLAERLADAGALASLLWGLWVHYQTRTEFRKAWTWLARLEDVAGTATGSDLAIVRDMSVGCQHFWEADHDRALARTDALRTAYARDRHGHLAQLTNHDPLVFAQHWAGSLADWITGHPDRAVERMEEAVDLARRIGHPFNLVFALTAGATALVYLDRPNDLLAYNDEAAQVAATEALGPFSEHVNIMQWRGAALVIRGDCAEGHDLLRAGNDFWWQSGGRICSAMFWSWIALGLTGLGRPAEALERLDRSIAHCRATGDRYMEPECLRLKADLLRGTGETGERVEALYRASLARAGEQGAAAWSLRASTSLAAFQIDSGRRADARATLEPALEPFAALAESPDMRKAAALLAEIA